MGTGRLRTAAPAEPPCRHCYGACCRQHAGHPFAVLLDDDEAELYPERVEVEKLYARRIEGADGLTALPYVDGKCVHLGDDDRCGIYDGRPKRCREFSCLNGYRLKGEDRHSFFLEDNPRVVAIIETHCPEFQNARGE